MTAEEICQEIISIANERDKIARSNDNLRELLEDVQTKFDEANKYIVKLERALALMEPEIKKYEPFMGRTVKAITTMVEAYREVMTVEVLERFSSDAEMCVGGVDNG